MNIRRTATLFLFSVFVLSLGIVPLSAQNADGETITWPLEGITDLVSLDPPRASDAQGYTVLELLYGGLVRLDGNLDIVPDLAESWVISEDGLVYTFTLRENILFSDGTPITAQDVVWSLNHAVDPAVGNWTGPLYLSSIVGVQDVVSGAATELAGVKAPDDRTVEITISAPSAIFLGRLTFGTAKIVSQAAAEANENWAELPVSSGAFQVEAWNHGQDIVLIPNPNYWQPATISRLTLPFIQDSETAYQLYRTGGVDITGNVQNGVPAVHLSDVRDLPDFHQAVAFSTRYLGFNQTKAPFDNVSVRQAFALAIDKDVIANQILNGAASPTDRILPPGIHGSEHPVEGLHFDVEAAKAALAAAGVTPESIGNITLSYAAEGDNERVVTVLQAQWLENLGINVTLEPLELSTFSARLNETSSTPESGLQLYYSVWTASYPDPQTFLSQQLRTGVGNNNGHFSNAEFDAITTEADASVLDPEHRLELYNQAEQIAVTNVGWLPLLNPNLNVLVQPYIEGFAFTSKGVIIGDYSALRGRPAQ